MEKVLQQINLVPGVIGSLVCNRGGEVLSSVFPPIFDPDTLLNASSLSVDFLAGLNEYTNGVNLIDLHCGEGRIIVKNMPRGFLLLLCTGAFNMQMLNIALNVAAGKLKAVFEAGSRVPFSPAYPAAPPTSGDGALQDGKGFALTTDSLAASAAIQGNQEQDGVANRHTLSEQIREALQIDSIKKIFGTEMSPYRHLERERTKE